MSKYGVFSGQYFPVFGLNMEISGINIGINTENYRPHKTPYLDTFHAVLWYHIKHLNALKIHPERIAKADRNMVNDFDYEDIEFPVSKKDCCKIEQINNICINVFCFEINLIYPVNISDQKLKDCTDLLMITDENNSHDAYIKDFDRIMCNKTESKNKKRLCRYCLQCFKSWKNIKRFI